MGAWFSENFAWSGFTSREQYRRWLPLIILFEIVQTLGLWVWGERGMIRMPFTPAAIPFLLVFLPLSIGFILLSARRLQSAGITRRWMLPMFLHANVPLGEYYLNCAAVWTWGIIFVAAVKPDIPEEARLY